MRHEEKIADRYFLGHFVNQQGEQYCTVYSSEATSLDREVIKLNHDPNNVWDQVSFCSPDYFNQCVEAGFAVGSPEALQVIEEWMEEEEYNNQVYGWGHW